MQEDPRYESWKQGRADVSIPEGFADRVMDAVHSRASRHRVFLLRRIAAAVVASRCGRAAIWSAALLLFAVRMGMTFAILVPR